MKLIVASNRLPFKVIDDKIVRSDGGLSSCLNNLEMDFTWIGWLNKKLDSSNIKSIYLTASEEERYYNNFCNKFLWYIFNKFWKIIKAASSTTNYAACWATSLSLARAG